jgi:hypothetical protein
VIPVDPRAWTERYAVLGTVAGGAGSIGAAIALGSPGAISGPAVLVGAAAGALTGTLYSWLKHRT